MAIGQADENRRSFICGFGREARRIPPGQFTRAAWAIGILDLGFAAYSRPSWCDYLPLPIISRPWEQSRSSAPTMLLDCAMTAKSYSEG